VSPWPSPFDPTNPTWPARSLRSKIPIAKSYECPRSQEPRIRAQKNDPETSSS